MRIGEFARINSVSIETVRYYMDLGLIVPVKKGGQYHFDSNCMKRLETVLVYKSMGFTLQEIKKMFHFMSLSRLHNDSERAFYRQFFKDNLLRINTELDRLETAKKLAEEALESIALKTEDEGTVIGIPLSTLSMLSCPKCGGGLELKAGSVRNNKIIDGQLLCSCESVYEVEDGILLISPVYESVEYKNTTDARVEYFETTSDEYVEKIFIAGEWFRSVMGKLDQGLKILEPGIGFGYALTQSLTSIPPGSTYVGVDRNINRLKALKAYFEKSDLKFDLLLIAADFLQIPLREKSIDLVMDMSGSSNRAFESENFLLREIDGLIKDHAEVFGIYIIADGMNGEYIDPKFHRLFQTKAVVEELKALDYLIDTDYTTKKVTSGGPHESFVDYVKSTWSYCCHARR